MRVAFTGHRPEKIGGYDRDNPTRRAIKSVLAAELSALPQTDLICLSGMALGFDQDAAEVCYSLGIPYIAVVPFAGQEKVWPLASRKHYETLLERAASVVTVCEGGYAPFKLQKRNEYLVDNSDLLIAAWDGSKGGTCNCVHYAEKIGRDIRRLDWQV
jgi:uncharacterized phage-like protein YoqJ